MIVLIEVPDPQIIIGVIVAFLVGVIGVIAYNKIRLFTGQKMVDPSYLSRLEYYERQLIDMKIRLDALDLEERVPLEPVSDRVEPLLEKKEHPIKKEEIDHRKEPEKLAQKQRIPNMDFNSISEYVLGLITTKEMTSRDIQNTLGRSREHTSRLLKRLFEDDLVERNDKKRPFTYRITAKGKAKISTAEHAITA